MFLYTTSLHWAVTQMTPGSMGVVPSNSFERAWNIGFLIVSLFCSAMVVSQLSARIIGYQMKNNQRSTQSATLTLYLSENNVSFALTQSIQMQVRARNTKERLGATSVELLSKLSVVLRQELACAVFHRHLLTHTIFVAWHMMHERTTMQLCYEVMHFASLTTDDEPFVPESIANRIFVVVQGTLSYSAERRAIGNALGNKRLVISGRLAKCMTS